MLECLILGDSIAVGVGQARPECVTRAIIGITSARFLLTPLPARMAGTIIISLGANDTEASVTGENVRTLRASMSAPRVYWLLAAGSSAVRDAVRQVAASFRDRVIDIAPLVGSDGIHPDKVGYGHLADLTRSGGRLERDGGRSAYRAFPPPNVVYRSASPVSGTLRAPSEIRIWNGPNNPAGR